MVAKDNWIDYLEGPLPHPSGNGTYIYKLLTGAYLYRGTNGGVYPSDVLSHSAFFGDYALALYYCHNMLLWDLEETPNLYQFEVTTPVTLLAMDDCRTINQLMQNTKYRAIHLDRAFLCNSAAQKLPYRASTKRRDYIISDEICLSSNTDGYAAAKRLPMSSRTPKIFHPEVFLCQPTKFVKFIQPIYSELVSKWETQMKYDPVKQNPSFEDDYDKDNFADIISVKRK
jgi:hypothetical protein